MSFLPLTFGVGRKSGAEGVGGSKPPSKDDVEKTLKRDDYACRFCGFRSLKFQQVIALDKELVTSCIFCEQVKILDRAGYTGGGVLIWVPEIAQIELNHIARAIYVAQSDENTPIASFASRALDALMSRRTEIKKRLGSDDPLLLATLLHENLTDKECENAIAKLDGVRLMPYNKFMVRGHEGDYNAFPQMVKFWKSAQGPFAKLPTDTWEQAFTKLAA